MRNWLHEARVFAKIAPFWVRHHRHEGFRIYSTEVVFGFWCRTHETGIGFGGEPGEPVDAMLRARKAGQ